MLPLWRTTSKKRFVWSFSVLDQAGIILNRVDCPQLSSEAGQGATKTGTNTAALSSNRKWGESSKNETDWRDRPSSSYDRDRDHGPDRRHDHRREKEARDALSYSRRSRSPPPRRRSRSRSGGRRYSRSPPPRNRHNDRSPKRRRLD